MEDIKKYIESGVLEEYCLGLLTEEDRAQVVLMSMLYPEIKAELSSIELSMERMAMATAVKPDPKVKQRMLAELGLSETSISFDLADLPAINNNASHGVWLNTVSGYIPKEVNEDFICEVLRKDDRLQQMLVITKNDILEEEHSDYLESFLILEGSCECFVGENHHILGQGDFLEIPLFTKHNIKLTSPYVIAILQYQFN